MLSEPLFDICLDFTHLAFRVRKGTSATPEVPHSYCVTWVHSILGSTETRYQMTNKQPKISMTLR